MNQGHTGNLDLETATEWMWAWRRRIIPQRFTLMGGEPALHSDLTKFVYLSRKMWPNSYIEVISNGFFLHRHPDLCEALRKTRTVLGVSIHHDSPEYNKRFAPVYKLMREWMDKGAEIEVRPSIQHWIRQYQGFGNTMEPYEDNDPKNSWKYCVSKLCVQLHEGKLWKCPALAYLPMQAEKYNLSEKWDPYLKYVPLDQECSEKELRDFFTRREESFCKMCPNAEHYFTPDSPLKPVNYWKKKYDT
tara:strand:+ start:5802 stop:6539 length:738 start_codon:yes stop_codon:yes gene_type:complete